MAGNTFETILEALKAAREKGYTCRFVVEKGHLRCLENNEIYDSSGATIDNFLRVRGPADPDDSAALYLIQTNTGVKGTLTDAFGTYANSEITDLIKKIDIGRGTFFEKTETKKCLNCGEDLRGLYCSHCGQKDVHLREPIWRLFAEAFSDYWHFDNKFLRTMVPLLINPGFLTNQFNIGKRERYVQPIRLYFFISVVFFVAYFSSGYDKSLFVAPREVDLYLPQDSVGTQMNKNEKLKKLNEELSKDVIFTDDSIPEESSNTDSAQSEEQHNNIRLGFSSKKGLPKTVEAYDDSIRKLPKGNRPGLIRQFFTRKGIEINSKDKKEVLTELSESAAHNLPKLMFFLLPVFAIILKLVYIRRRVYLVDHAIFTLHLHAFIFLFFLIILLLSLFIRLPFLSGIAASIILIYLTVAMKKVYNQSWGKTVLKSFVLLMIYFLAALTTTLAYIVVLVIFSV